MITINPSDAVDRISVVVPSYNQAEYLDEALGSLISQNYPDLEIIVMDGGSTDGSVDTIKKFEDKLSYWQSCPDGGQSRAIHEGFLRSSGTIIGWLNSDDRLAPGALAHVAAAFRGERTREWVYGDTEVIDVESRRIEIRRTVSVDLLDLVNLSYYLPQESSFFSRALYFRSPGLDTSLHYAMDYDLWLKFARLTTPYHVDSIVGAFRYRPGQKSSDRSAYRAEELKVKAQYTEFRLPNSARLQRLLRLKGATFSHRVRADGLTPVVRKQVRTLRGQGPKLGASRFLAGSLVIGVPVLAGSTAFGGWRLLRRCRSTARHRGAGGSSLHRNMRTSAGWPDVLPSRTGRTTWR